MAKLDKNLLVEDLYNYLERLKAGAHESYVLRKMSFVTIGLSQLLSFAGNLSSDFGHSWHVSQISNMFDNFGHE